MKKIINKNNKVENPIKMTDAMLKLENIKKDYKVSGNNEPVHALKGVTINFRANEFVSILGPSGCGKTTLLNIIGGLDKYTSGDLIISGKSTKKYTDRDWDVYRNHRIGFIFQSYNLIPHQTILGNVELALTISGMSKKERVEKAKKALDKVGLAGMYNKRPNQLSGGQCQRVAIARALVNEPEILLADEPTGALDTNTSKQIMDLIAEIAKEKLVIMVTHNPEIAEEYSTRIIRLLDGSVIDDTNPFNDKIIEKKPVENVKEKSKMSFFTAFRLSLRNLISKLKRTILVCVAGSIGIVGVSTVLAVSSGIHNYIDSMQDDMLSGNPITISEVGFDLSSMIGSASTFEKVEILKKNGYVNVNSLIEYLIKQSETRDEARINNEITEEYVNYILNMSHDDYSAMNLDFGLDLTHGIYTDWHFSNSSLSDIQSKEMSVSAITKMYTSVLGKTDFKEYSSYISQLDNVFAQAPNDNDYILSQYDLLDGRIASNENEIMVVINKNNQLTDIVLAQLGYYSQEEFINIVYRATNDSDYKSELDKNEFPFKEIRDKKFTWYPNNTIFDKTPSPVTPFTYKAYADGYDGKYAAFSKNDAIDLEVVGILQAKDTISYGCLRAGFYYTEALTNKVLQTNRESEIANYYIEADRKANEENEDYDPNKKTDPGSITITSGAVPYQYPFGDQMIEGVMDTGITFNYDYYYYGSDDKNNTITIPEANVTGYLGNESTMSAFLGMLQGFMGGSSSGIGNTKYFQVSLRQLGASKVPNRISIYPIDFESKYKVTEYLDEWNKDIPIEVNGEVIEYANRTEITYSDNLEIIIGLINTMIDIVTYALIVFTALSLLVSTIMIGIITYVSVVERVKEIGVIRSLGGRKRDVSALFIAETFIIGLVSGVIGILITIGLSGIINLIVGHFSGIYTIAALPFTSAIVMITVSVILTLISGVFPAKAAARKDPVEALRTE